jgi:hypothetical protein
MPESTCKMMQAQLGQVCEREDRNLLGEMLFDIFQDLSLLSHGQAAANPRRSAWGRFFRLHDFFCRRKAWVTHLHVSPIRLAICISWGD